MFFYADQIAPLRRGPGAAGNASPRYKQYPRGVFPNRNGEMSTIALTEGTFEDARGKLARQEASR